MLTMTGGKIEEGCYIADNVGNNQDKTELKITVVWMQRDWGSSGLINQNYIKKISKSK